MKIKDKLMHLEDGSMWLSSLIGRIRVGYNWYFVDYFFINKEQKDTIYKIIDQCNSEDNENKILTFELILSELKVNKNEFIQEGIKWFKGKTK